MADESLADYKAFLQSKRVRAQNYGFEPPALNANLFPHQAEIVRFALTKGRAAMFVDTGLGKTLMQLDWARCVHEHTNGPVLILTPLAVAAQTVREGAKFGIAAKIVREDADCINGVNVANYERLEKLDASRFSGVVLDESSILKNFSGKTFQALCEAFKHTPYRLACTATPAPNDYMELGNHSEFLGILRQVDMLTRWFLHDSSDTKDWRLKGHAVSDFWDWVASWARCVSMPSDLGYSDAGFVLPELRTVQHVIETDLTGTDGQLFRNVELSATSLHREKRATLDVRADQVAELVNGNSEPWVVWCDTNDEADALTSRISDAVEVRGNHTAEQKETRLLGFSDGDYRVIVSKASIAGFGLNWQHCARMAFVGVNYSYEAFYQAVRRCWRFGQQRSVEAHVVMAQTESAIWNAVMRKSDAHDAMKDEMRAAMLRNAEKTKEAKILYMPGMRATLPAFIRSAA
jgi:superfamily II DNA or RNA helicase